MYTMKQKKAYRWALMTLMIISFLTLAIVPVYAASGTEPGKQVSDAVMRLIKVCQDHKVGYDQRDIATVVDYVISQKQHTEYVLPESQKCPGAYQEFDTRVSFSRFMNYSYSSLIPSSVTRPSSLRFSLWNSARGKGQNLPASWKPLSPNASPVIVHGFQYDSNTPDLTTGVYYAYNLKRTLIHTNYKGHQVLISISKQIDKSNVGEKGFILGRDSDWNYYYSGEPGSAKAGLGWVKSHIYDYFSVGVYVETDSKPVKLRSGVFQWIRAGWSGINFVQTSHILNGMKRFARNNRMVLESPRLPAQNKLISVYQWLNSLPHADLSQKYGALQQAQRAAAAQSGKISSAKTEAPLPASKAAKEQMVEELMLEYVKMAMGKPTSMGKHFTMAK